MFTYKGYTAKWNKTEGYWTVKTPHGVVCLMSTGTQRDVKQSINWWIREHPETVAANG